MKGSSGVLGVIFCLFLKNHSWRIIRIEFRWYTLEIIWQKGCWFIDRRNDVMGNGKLKIAAWKRFKDQEAIRPRYLKRRSLRGHKSSCYFPFNRFTAHVRGLRFILYIIQYIILTHSFYDFILACVFVVFLFLLYFSIKQIDWDFHSTGKRYLLIH